MERSKIVSDKIEELIALAKVEGDPNVQIVLLGLQGARESGDDGMLAGKVQEYIRDVLIPRAEAKRLAHKASQN